MQKTPKPRKSLAQLIGQRHAQPDPCADSLHYHANVLRDGFMSKTPVIIGCDAEGR